MMNLKYILALFIIALAVIAAAFYMTLRLVTPEQLSNGAEVSFNKPFEMVDMQGQAVDAQRFLGRPTLYFFGFTHCPEICPTRLGSVTAWLHGLGADADKLNVVFVSVDPERDTPAVLADYMKAFDPRIMAVTATPDELERVAKVFMIYYAKVPLDDGDYTMNHSAAVLLADEKGNFRGAIGMEESDEKALEKIRNII